MTQSFIYITTQTEFIHAYPDAPDEVAYLRNPHRHLAHIRIQVEVFDDDREIEFIMFKHRVDEYLDLNTMSNRSCEMIARELLEFVQQLYGTHRDVSIEVSEDGENGAELIYRR